MKRKTLVILCVAFAAELLFAGTNHWFYSYNRVRMLLSFSNSTIDEKDDMDSFLDPKRYYKYQARNLINFPLGLASYFRIRKLESGLIYIYENHQKSDSDRFANVQLNRRYKIHDAVKAKMDAAGAMLWLYKSEAKFAGFLNLHKDEAEQAEPPKPRQ